tara:strand:- start:993 stop:1514 length:522 start_codon:yes stop_codon:yes gene_type:complete
MPIEIERRFIVNNDKWKKIIVNQEEICQGYISNTSNEWTIRVRITNNTYSFLTLKLKANSISNYEYEYEIPPIEAKEIIKMTPYRINKIRYKLKLDGRDWCVDCFQEKNYPLVIAEVELDSEETQIKKPLWCGDEITGQYKWSNAYLAKTSISDWSISKRLSIDNEPTRHSTL